MQRRNHTAFTDEAKTQVLGPPQFFYNKEMKSFLLTYISKTKNNNKLPQNLGFLYATQHMQI